MSVFERIAEEIDSGMILYTPVRRARFTVDSVDAENGMVVFFVGTKTRIKIPKACWDGVSSFLRGKDWVEIGARHDTAPLGTFEEYLDRFWKQGKTHASAASYVVPVLEHLGIAEVDHGIPSRIRLKQYQP